MAATRQNKRQACHCPPVALASDLTAIGKLQSRAQTFKLRYVDRELEILYLNGTFGVLYLYLYLYRDNLHVTVFAMRHCLVRASSTTPMLHPAINV
jgi:hypothetical protein